MFPPITKGYVGKFFLFLFLSSYHTNYDISNCSMNTLQVPQAKNNSRAIGTLKLAFNTMIRVSIPGNSSSKLLAFDWKFKNDAAETMP